MFKTSLMLHDSYAAVQPIVHPGREEGLRTRAKRKILHSLAVIFTLY
jgi:hypothetical protein